MAASVRIEDEAFVDTRIEMLGALAGYNRFEALGRMAHLWRVCTQRESYVLDPVWVDACLGPGGAGHLIAAGLGEKSDGGIRIRGTGGRIEWLKQRREAARKGGTAKACRTPAKRQPTAKQTVPTACQTPAGTLPNACQTPAGSVPSGCPPTPTPCLLTEDTPLPPTGGVMDGSVPKGPNPQAVVAWWNAQKKLLPCGAGDPNRDQKIRQWATSNPDWCRHWRDVIAFMGRTPKYCNETEIKWHPPLSKLFDPGVFAKACDEMLAARPAAPAAPADQRAQLLAHYRKQVKLGSVTREEAEKMIGGPLSD